jgi:hypothetical protein
MQKSNGEKADRAAPHTENGSFLLPPTFTRTSNKIFPSARRPFQKARGLARCFERKGRDTNGAQSTIAQMREDPAVRFGVG